MITAQIAVGSLRSLKRLDAWYYLAPGAAASRSLESAKAAGIPTCVLGGNDGVADVWAPARFKRAYAAEGEDAIPYLAPHDMFEYLPEATLSLSRGRTRSLPKYLVKRGMVLQTCSGRNLGPSTIVDAVLSNFVMSHDLVRIEIADERLRNYIVGFMHSSTGQGLLRRDKSGSVIDHITDEHVAAQEIPLLRDSVVDAVADLVGTAFALVESARLKLASELTSLHAALPLPERDSPAKFGWGTRRSSIRDRLDAASHDPWVQSVREMLLEAGGRPLGEAASVVKPAGRYRTRYVGRRYGTPILSGTQVLQHVLVHPQYMAPSAFDDPSAYQLEEGWSVYMADGRAEKGLGGVACVTSDRSGWFASGHVGRVVPGAGVSAGALWLACRTKHVQVQIKSLASGSVVDSTFPADMEGVILPPLNGIDGAAIVSAWNQFSTASALEAEAQRLIDREMAAITDVDTELVQAGSEDSGDTVADDEGYSSETPES